MIVSKKTHFAPSSITNNLEASNNIVGLNEHIISFSNEKGFVTLESKGNDWVSDFKLYTINKKLVKKRIYIKKKVINKNFDTRIYPVSKIIDIVEDSLVLEKLPSLELEESIYIMNMN